MSAQRLAISHRKMKEASQVQNLRRLSDVKQRDAKRQGESDAKSLEREASAASLVQELKTFTADALTLRDERLDMLTAVDGTC